MSEIIHMLKIMHIPMSCGSQPVIISIPQYFENAASKEGNPF